MTAAKHTPALQKRWKYAGHRTIVTDDAGHLLICEVFSGGIGIEDADKVQQAIAALPELLGAAQEYMRACPADEDSTPEFQAASNALSAALVKATGSAA